MDEGEQFQVNRLDQIFNKNIGETSPNQEKLHICKYKKHREYQLDKKKTPLWSIIVKTLSIYNTIKKIIDSYKRKNTNHIKGQLIRITADLSRNCESQKICSNAFQVLKDLDNQLRLMSSAKLSTLVEGERKKNPWYKQIENI